MSRHGATREHVDQMLVSARQLRDASEALENEYAGKSLEEIERMEETNEHADAVAHIRVLIAEAGKCVDHTRPCERPQCV